MADDRELEQERFQRLRATEDPDLRAQLVEDHLWLARHCAARFARKGEGRDDLEQVAAMALVKAVDRFDPGFKVRFATFAVPTIQGDLRRHFRDATWSMRVSRRLKDLHVELRSTDERLTQDLGRSPTIDELAEALGTTSEEVLEALEAGEVYRAGSLSAPPAGEDDQNDLDPGMDDEALAATSERVVLHQALQALPERERRAVYLRFYLGLSQSEIAAEIGVSQVHVSRILRATLERLGDELQPTLTALAEP